MRKKIIISIIASCTVITIFTGMALAQSTTSKRAITGFSSMAASIEKNYGAILELELTMRNGEPVYKADTVIGGKLVRVHFDAITGKEIEKKAATALDDEELVIYNRFNLASAASERKTTTSTTVKPTATPTQSGTVTTKITAEKAKQIALAKVGGGTVKDIELDRENGRQVYDIEIRYNNLEYDVKVDAATGEIVKFKIDD